MTAKGREGRKHKVCPVDHSPALKFQNLADSFFREIELTHFVPFSKVLKKPRVNGETVLDSGD
jgi:hypothetical protein